MHTDAVAEVVEARALGVVPHGARPLVAVSMQSGLVAVSCCGRVVHLLEHTRLRCSWRMSAQLLSLQWWPDGTAVFAITRGGAGWRLGVEAQPTPPNGGDCRESKRSRTCASAWARPVGEANRVHLPLPAGTEAILPCEVQGCCALACGAQTPSCLLPFPTWPQNPERVMSRAFPQLRGGPGSCALCVVSSSATGEGTTGMAPIAPILFHALVGGAPPERTLID